MNLDFPMIMVLAAFITGVIWALDALLWAPKRRAEVAKLKTTGAEDSDERVKTAAKEPIMVEYARSFFPVILLVLLLRSFLVEPFRIPSGSMIPTLLVGDFILVNKYAYGLRLPVLDTKIVPIGEPKRGDVVVFRYPKEPSVDYIKRVIGLPGDHIAYINKTLYVNGEKISVDRKGPYVSETTGMRVAGIDMFLEHLNDVEHDLLRDANRASFDMQTTVPEGHYFVMGDNRDNSNDSRYWGTVPEENLVGKAFFIWMNWDRGIDWKRIGTTIE